MFIYLDETYNLQKGTKNQFLAVAGFSTLDPKETGVLYRKLKKKSLPKKISTKEIKSTDRFSKNYILNNILSEKHKIYGIKVGGIIQNKKNLGKKYFTKKGLNYDILYIDLVKKLIETAWKYQEKEVVIISVDTFIPRSLNKEDIKGAILSEVKTKNPGVNFYFEFVTSEDINIQLADQICGIIGDFAKGEYLYKRKLEKYYKTRIIVNDLSK